MPFVNLHTNVKASDLKEGIEARVAKVVAETLGKPLESIIVVVVPGIPMFHKNTPGPACTLQIYSVGVFDPERNPKYTPPLKAVLKEELGVETNKISILYQAIEITYVG